MSASMAARRPVRTLESGGAAGVTAAGLVGRLIGAPAVISFDMGGTTAKVGIVRDGRPGVITDFQVGGKGSFGGTRAGTGFPVKIPTVDLAEVGAGGGSIAWLDADGALRVGPRSAGAVPGPCVLRPRRHGADRHRRRPAARLPRSRGARRRRGALGRRREPTRLARGGGRSARHRGHRSGARPSTTS